MFNSVMNNLLNSLLKTFDQIAEELCDAHDVLAQSNKSIMKPIAIEIQKESEQDTF